MLFLSLDPCLGSEEHETLSAGVRVLTQPCGGVWRPKSRDGNHQEHEEESQLSWQRPLHQSGKERYYTRSDEG